MKKILLSSLILFNSLFAFDICGDKVDLKSIKTFDSSWIEGIDIETDLKKYEKKFNKEICNMYINNDKKISHFNIYQKMDSIPSLPEKINKKNFVDVNLVTVDNEEQNFKSYKDYLNFLKNKSLKILKANYVSDNEKITISTICLDGTKKCGYNFTYYTEQYKEKESLYKMDSINDQMNKIKKANNFN